MAKPVKDHTKLPMYEVRLLHEIYQEENQRGFESELSRN